MVDDRDLDIFNFDSETFDTEPDELSVETSIDSLLSGLDDQLPVESDSGTLDEDWSFLNETPEPDTTEPLIKEGKKKKKQKKTPKEKKVKEKAPEPELTGLAASIARHHRPINAILSLLSVALIIGIICMFFLQVSNDPFGRKILDNVYIAGVSVGGMTEAEAVQAVGDVLSTGYQNKEMVVELNNQEIVIPASAMHLSPNAWEAVKKAYALGRTGSASDRQKAYRMAKNGTVIVDISDLLGLDSNGIRNMISAAAQKMEGEYTPSGYTLEGAKPPLDADNFDSSIPCQVLTLTYGTPGTGTDIDRILASILEAYSNHQFHVTVPADQLPQMPDALNIDAIYAELCSAPVEASVDDTGKETSGVCGYTFSLDSAREELNNAHYGDIISIPMEYNLPANLEMNGDYTFTLSSYSTPLSNLSTYDQNMKLFCDAIDGIVINAGETLSLNSQVPVRNESTGYMPAVKHAGYCLTEHAAGGVDQVASTLYAAALKADLKIPEKHYADHICGYTVAGTELTVESTWQDLKIKNPLDTPIKIRAKLNNTSVVIRILGQEKPDYYFEFDTEITRQHTPGVVYVPQSSSSAYANNDVILEGTPGASIKLNIIKYDTASGQEISRDAQYADLPSASRYIASGK